MDGMVIGLIFGAVLVGAGLAAGTWLAERAQDRREELEYQLGTAIAEQQQEIQRLRNGASSDSSAEDLGL